MTNAISRRAAVWLAGLTLVAGAHSAWALETVKVGTVSGVTADAVLALQADAKAQGIDLQVIEFTDWTLPNEAVSHGDIDLNFFQHQPFLANAIKERGYKLSFLGYGLLQNVGLYSQKITALSALPDKAKVAIPNDPVNRGRGLLLLQKAGLITLRTGDATGATLDDVATNPKQLRFYEIEGPQLIRSLPDVDLAVVWPSYFVNAGQKDKAGSALLYSGVADRFYAMGFVGRSDRANEPKLRKFVELFQNSPAVRKVIDNSFGNNPKLYTLPWQN